MLDWSNTLGAFESGVIKGRLYRGYTVRHTANAQITLAKPRRRLPRNAHAANGGGSGASPLRPQDLSLSCLPCPGSSLRYNLGGERGSPPQG
jgi:hypothetical protein